MANDIGLFRIVGNQLPRRDEAGARLKACGLILKEEPAFPGVDKIWILNRIYDQHFLAQLVHLLSFHRATIKVIPFSGVDYRLCTGRSGRMRYAVNPNIGRNLALSLGRDAYKHTMVFDGDCALSGWHFEQIAAELKLERRGYYSVPMVRLRHDEYVNLTPAVMEFKKLEEPQLIAAQGTDECFKEDQQYGDNDKNELLWRLGHSRKHGRQYELDRADRCLSVGRAIHVNTGSDRVESSLPDRVAARAAGIDMLLRDIDTEFCHGRDVQVESGSVYGQDG